MAMQLVAVSKILKGDIAETNKADSFTAIAGNSFSIFYVLLYLPLFCDRLKYALLKE